MALADYQIFPTYETEERPDNEMIINLDLRISTVFEYGQEIMKKLFIAILAAAVLPLSPTSASAAGAEAPTWAADTGLPSGFTWGNWFPCRSEYQTSDCIESVAWLKTDGTKIEGIWTPQENFSFADFKQNWVKENNGESAQYFDSSIAQAGSYSFEGMVNPCGNNQIVIDARAVHYGFQLNAQSTCGQFFSSKFEERFEITVRSKFLKGNAGAISSNGKNPGLKYAESGKDQLLTIKANFAYIAWNDIQVDGKNVDVCQKNEYKARSGGWGLWNTIVWVNMLGDSWLATHPGDMITGTNGWNCGGTMYWDAEQGGLVMQVGSPHYDPNGEVVEGWFEGAIRGRYVNARFGIKPQFAAGSARLEIIYNNGEKKVATITAKYDAATDWIYLKGYGFTYSNPKLIVKFGNATKAPQSIICVKGKVTKKVIGTNPTCPAGYKQK